GRNPSPRRRRCRGAAGSNAAETGWRHRGVPGRAARNPGSGDPHTSAVEASPPAAAQETARQVPASSGRVEMVTTARPELGEMGLTATTTTSRSGRQRGWRRMHRR
ncbi:hypothetical protein EE612_045685, partial [Oryza sativa]